MTSRCNILNVLLSVAILLTSPVLAGDTIFVLSDHYAGVAPDTFKLQNQRKAADVEDLLFQLLAKQGKEIYRRDSIQQDSLLSQLVKRDSLIRLQLDSLRDQLTLTRDSIEYITRSQYARRKKDSLDIVAQKRQITDKRLVEIDSLTNELELRMNINTPEIARSIFRDLDADLADVARAIRDQNSHWYKEANVLVQFTQNYISPNWYKGGNSEFSILTMAKGYINYNKNAISWENTGEWRAGVTTTPRDTLRKYNVTDDIFRLYSKFGYRIVNKLYATASAEFNTTLWNVWNENQTTAKTAFMTPMKFYLSAGLDCRPVKDLSILFAPATYKLVYAHFGDGDSIRNIDVTKYGIKPGGHLLSEFGSLLRVNWKWRPYRELAIDTEFYLYTNYRSVEIDWEINTEFLITRFLSIRLMLHPRFDSAYIAEGDTKPKMQFKELLSIGFSHKFR